MCYSKPCISRPVSCRVVRTSSNDHFVTLFRLDSWKFHVSLSLYNIANLSVCLCWYINGQHRRPIPRDCVPCEIATDQEDGVFHISGDFGQVQWSLHCLIPVTAEISHYLVLLCKVWKNGHQNVRSTLDVHALSYSFFLSFCQESLRIASEKVPIPVLSKINDATVYQSRWSGDVIWRTGEKKFNTVSHNRARP